MDQFLAVLVFVVVIGAIVFFVDLWSKSPAGREAARKQAEEKASREKAAQDRLLAILQRHAGGEPVKAFGVAYWDTIGSKVSSAFDKVMGAALMGGIGMQMTGKTHHVGLLVVTDTTLHIIETGSLVGETIDGPGKVAPLSTQEKAKSFPLKGLSASAKPGSLTISGNLDMQAGFPNYSPYGEDNPAKAEAVAQAVNAGVRSAGGVGQSRLF